MQIERKGDALIVSSSWGPLLRIFFVAVPFMIVLFAHFVGFIYLAVLEAWWLGGLVTVLVFPFMLFFCKPLLIIRRTTLVSDRRIGRLNLKLRHLHKTVNECLAPGDVSDVLVDVQSGEGSDVFHVPLLLLRDAGASISVAARHAALSRRSGSSGRCGRRSLELRSADATSDGRTLVCTCRGRPGPPRPAGVVRRSMI